MLRERASMLRYTYVASLVIYLSVTCNSKTRSAQWLRQASQHYGTGTYVACLVLFKVTVNWW